MQPLACLPVSEVAMRKKKRRPCAKAAVKTEALRASGSGQTPAYSFGVKVPSFEIEPSVQVIV